MAGYERCLGGSTRPAGNQRRGGEALPGYRGAGGRRAAREGRDIGLAVCALAGVFYPRGLPQRLELDYASEHLDTVEINGSFYSLQTPSSFERWDRQTPDDFVFSVKGPRYVTHLLRLRNCRTALANFFASGVLTLAEKLGPVLWQLPERHQFDAGVLSEFLSLLPRSTAAAAALAAEHDARLDGRTALGPAEDRPLRHALEVRHPSFLSPARWTSSARSRLLWWPRIRTGGGPRRAR